MKSYLLIGAAFSAAFFSMHATAKEAGASGQATTVLQGGQVYTQEGWKTAVAYRGGKIIAVGSDAQVRAKAGKFAKLVDLHGRTVFPGLHDMHVHPLSAGTLMTQCYFEQGATPQQISDKLTGCVNAKKPGEWVQGGSWQAISFASTPMTRQWLDKVSPDNPVLLRDISGHSIWLNSMALKLSGITRDTQAPPGGVIERDAEGEPTGIIRETAMVLGRSAIPGRQTPEIATAIERAFSVLISYGITTATDAGVGQDAADAYKLLTTSRRLLPHVRGCIMFRTKDQGSDAFERLLANRESYRAARFSPDCVKFVTDGVPTEGHTAAMLEPYEDGPHDGAALAAEKGSMQIPEGELDEAVKRIDKMGLVGKFHAVGDEASQVVLNAIAIARRANGPNGPSHDIAHSTFITKENIQRARTLNVALEFSPYIWYPTVINDDIIKAVGPKRVERAWPVREALQAGVRADIGSDWPAGTPTANPWYAMEALVTRSTPDGARGKETFGPEEAITLRQAVDLFTLGGARQMGNLKTSGSIAVGKDADLIVLDRNPFEGPITEVHKTVVEETIVSGDTVYTKAK